MTKDPFDFRTLFHPTKHYFSGTNDSTMILWTVTSYLASYQELYCVIDQKTKPFIVKVYWDTRCHIYLVVTVHI